MSRPRWLSTNRVPLRDDLAGIRGADEVSLTGTEHDNRDRVWRDLQELYRSGMFPGVSFCLRHQGRLIMDRSLGHASGQYPNRSAPDPATLTPATPICLFSASKAITAMLIHHLVELNEISLNDRVTRFFPNYGRHGKQRTTLSHLLTHRAGIPRIEEDVDPETLFEPGRIMELLCRAYPQGLGRRQSYHALTGGFILGEVVERVTGERLNTVLDRVIRRPLGMEYFRFGLEGPNAAENVVTGLKNAGLLDRYMRHAVGTGLEDVVELSNDPRFRDVVIPAGNLYATAEEAGRFYQMLLNGGEWQGRQVFRPETVRRAIEPVTRRPRFDRTLLLPMHYSRGFMLGQRLFSLYGPGTPQAFGHLGFITIITWADPQRALSGALLTTGKAVIGTHLPGLVKLQYDINRLWQ